MNIFWLDPNPKIAAEYQCNQHVVKMILETAQILSTAHRVLDGEQVGKLWVLPDFRECILMKATHRNHPSMIWARSSVDSYKWTFRHLLGLLEEYTHRYGKIHAVQYRPDFLRLLETPPDNCPVVEMPPVPQCMPDIYKVPDDPVQAYRGYYLNEKVRFATWKVRPAPNWWF
jgi:hypothetical protein